MKDELKQKLDALHIPDPRDNFENQIIRSRQHNKSFKYKFTTYVNELSTTLNKLHLATYGLRIGAVCTILLIAVYNYNAKHSDSTKSLSSINSYNESDPLGDFELFTEDDFLPGEI